MGGGERKENINSFPYICLFIHLRHRRKLVARLLGVQDLTLLSVAPAGRGEVPFYSGKQKFWLLINKSDIKSVSNYEPIKINKSWTNS